MNKTNSKFELSLTTKIALAGFAILLGGGIYSYIRIHTLTQDVTSLTTHVTTLENRLASSTAEFITFTKTTNENFQRQGTGIAIVEQKVGNYHDQVNSVSTTVSTLEKLSKTDPQLLAKYSKVFFLSENYAPERLTSIPDNYKYSNTKAVSVQSNVWPHLQSLIDD